MTPVLQGDDNRRPRWRLRCNVNKRGHFTPSGGRTTIYIDDKPLNRRRGPFPPSYGSRGWGLYEDVTDPDRHPTPGRIVGERTSYTPTVTGTTSVVISPGNAAGTVGHRPTPVSGRENKIRIAYTGDVGGKKCRVSQGEWCGLPLEETDYGVHHLQEGRREGVSFGNVWSLPVCLVCLLRGLKTKLSFT